MLPIIRILLTGHFEMKLRGWNVTQDGFVAGHVVVPESRFSFIGRTGHQPFFRILRSFQGMQTIGGVDKCVR